MKHDMTFFLLIILFLATLPGCGGRVVDWAKDHVKQGEDLKKDKTVAQNYIKSIRVYDQFTLLGSFNSLWLSDEVREVYSDLYAMKHGKNEEQKKIFLRRQFEENNHFISFYITSPAEIVMGEKDSDWTVVLKVDDYNFAPTEFKTVDLCPEYKTIFGKKFNRFQIVYLLRFNARDIEDHALIKSDTKSVNLLLRTTKKEVLLSWNVDKKGALVFEYA